MAEHNPVLKLLKDG